MTHRISVILVHLKTFNEILYHPLDIFGSEFLGDGPAMLNDRGPYVESLCLGSCNSFLSADPRFRR